MSIQPCRPKSDSALPGAIWAQFRPKKLNQKAIPAHGRAYFSPGTKSAQLIGLYWPWFKGVKLDSKIGLYFTHRNGPIYFLGLKQIFLISSVIIRYCTRPVFAPSCAIGLVLKQRVDETQKSKRPNHHLHFCWEIWNTKSWINWGFTTILCWPLFPSAHRSIHNLHWDTWWLVTESFFQLICPGKYPEM